MSTALDRATAAKLILVVDDVEDNRLLLERLLKPSGYAILHASSGREALAIVSQQRPDLILLDWMMPELSGLETLRALRELHPKAHLPIFMCTALDEEVSVVNALAAGANDYLVKPISGAILRARMTTHLEQCAALASADRDRRFAERKLGEQAHAMFATLPRPSRPAC